MIFNLTGQKNSASEFFNQSNDTNKNYSNFQLQSSTFSGSSFKKEKLLQSNDKNDGSIFEYNSQRHTPTIIFPINNRGTNSPSTPSTSNSRRKFFPSHDIDDTMCETPKTPPKMVRNTSRFTTTSIKKERKHSDKDFSDIEIETTEKKKPKLKYYGDSPPDLILNDKPEETNNRLAHDYEVKEVLGKGSFGKVYKCIQKLDGMEYAIKETFRRFIGKNKSHALNETQALASLTAIDDNPNIVRYYFSWVEDEKLFLVMEYCPESLKQEKKKKGYYSETELRKILRDLCVGLKYIHGKNIVHLDIKPGIHTNNPINSVENILISKTHKYKLGDLGQSRLAINCQEDIEEGDARYLANELLNYDVMNKDGSSLIKADIFSLGMTIFELSTDCEIPSNGEEWHDLRNGKLDRLMEIPTISNTFKQLVKRMMEKNPDDRPTAEEILSHYIPEEKDVEAKWIKIEYKMLKEQKIKLENMLNLRVSRRKSF